MGVHLRGGTRTRTRVIRLNFTEILIKKEIVSGGVSGGFELSEFELTE